MFATAWFYVLALLGFGFVIAIHEFGHFLMAKWAGVRVEVFSIGFGPKLFGWRRGDTEYIISLLPLGGYVKMTGQEDLPENPPEGAAQDPAAPPPAPDPASYLSASAPWKAVILLGGVAFNLISSYVILVALAWYGYPTIRPLVGDLQPQVVTTGERVVESPAVRLGIHPGDEVVAINGQRIRSFEDLLTGTVDAGTGPIVLTVRRPGVAEELTLPEPGGPVTSVQAVYALERGLPMLGLEPAFSNRVVDAGLPLTSPLPANGPQPGDRVVAIDGKAVAEPATGQSIQRALAGRFGDQVAFELEDRRGIRRQGSVTYAGPSGGFDGTLGLPVRVGQVTAGMPAALAGVLPGDVVEAVAGIPVCGVEHFMALIPATGAGGSLTLAIRRAGEPMVIVVPTRQTLGKPMIGLAPEPLLDGPIGVIAPALDGLPSAAAAARISTDDSIVARRPSDLFQPIKLWLVHGGNRILLPLGKDGRTKAVAGAKPGLVARLVGAEPVPTLADQLIGSRVVAIAGPDGVASGAPEPGLLQLARADGSPLTVDIRPLGTASAALLAGLTPGDWITGLARNAAGEPAWAVLRGGGAEARQVELAPRQVGPPLTFFYEETPYQLQSPLEAFAIANHATYAMTMQSLKMIPKFFQSSDNGGLSAEKSLQGPIGIFAELKTRAERSGISSWLKLVALIGLNLVLVNLLPIPITDGGQLVILGIESAIGRPLNPTLKNIVMWIGLGLVLALMLFVIWLDVSRRI